MTVRASQQRDARLAAAAAGAVAEVTALPAVAALTDAELGRPGAPGPWAGSGQPGGDDDSDGELDAVSDDDFYADAFEVLA